jgi:hypothetical protein
VGGADPPLTTMPASELEPPGGMRTQLGVFWLPLGAASMFHELLTVSLKGNEYFTNFSGMHTVFEENKAQ